MRRSFVLVVVLSLSALGSIVGCGAKSEPRAKDGKPVVAFVTNNPYEFWTIARRGTEKAAKEFDVTVDFQMPPRGTAAEQRSIIEDLLAKGIEGIAISPNDSANQARFLKDVAARVPLVTQDSDLPEGSGRLCYIGTENYEAGKGAGKLVREAMPEGGKIVIYVGKMDAQNAIERRQGVLDELAGTKGAEGPELGKYTLLDTMTDDAKQDKCKANVEDTLVKYGSEPNKLCLVGLWAYNPPAMLAAVKGASLAGAVRIVGFDENEETLQGVQDGDIYGTIVQQPFEFGYHAVRILGAVARGDKSVIPENGILYIPHREIKRDNVGPFWDELKKLKAG
ncbi:MAG TPA: sugar-binding protein [Pirellulales bacterium]|nr:sugar-binding protein [Pirellulales bacterium]